jgi:hypothetical protein
MRFEFLRRELMERIILNTKTNFESEMVNSNYTKYISKSR